MENTAITSLYNKLKSEVKPLNIFRYGFSRIQIIVDGECLIIQHLNNNFIGTQNDSVVLESEDEAILIELVKEWIYFSIGNG